MCVYVVLPLYATYTYLYVCILVGQRKVQQNEIVHHLWKGDRVTQMAQDLSIVRYVVGRVPNISNCLSICSSRIGSQYLRAA